MITNPIYEGELESLSRGDSTAFLNVFLPHAIGLLFVSGVLFFFFMLIWGAISWIISGGDKAYIESSRSRITNALVGLVILFSTFAVVKLIEAFFGIDILSIDIGPLIIQ
jgi:hypothetical protein